MLRSWLTRAWRARLYVPLTPLGALVLITAAFVQRHYAAGEVDFVLHAASMVAIGLVGASVAMVVVVSGFLWTRSKPAAAQTAALELESGVSAATGFFLPRLRSFPLVGISLAWETPARVDVSLERVRSDDGRTRWQEVVHPHERGRQHEIRRRLLVSDIFGLSRLGLPRRSARATHIRPGRARISGHVLAHLTGGDHISHPTGPASGELLDMRRYAHGDPLRHVLWKAYARTRQLLVRTPERAITPSPSGVAYFVAGRDDEPTASAARFFLDEGLLGRDFIFGADGSDEPTSDTQQALEQLTRSVSARAHGGQGLARFLDRIDARRRQHCVLFVPPSPGPWLPAVERAAARLPRASVVMALDHELDAPARSTVHRLLFADENASRRALRAVPPLIERLAKGGFDVRLLHRPSGQLLQPQQLQALAR